MEVKYMRIIELIELEDFKNIPKAKWTYIDENGILFTHRTTKGNYRKERKIIKGTINQDGYIRDDFLTRTKTERYGFRIFRHQIVAMAFLNYNIGDYYNNVEIDHIDRVRTNNKVSNLRIVNRQENVDNTSNIKKTLRKLNKNDIINIYVLRFIKHQSYKSISNIYNISGNSIRDICLGRTYKEIHDKEIANFI